MSDLRTTAIADVIRRRLEGQPQDEDWATQIALVTVPATEAVIAAEIKAFHDAELVDDRNGGQPRTPDWYAALAHAEWIALGRPEDHQW